MRKQLGAVGALTALVMVVLVLSDVARRVEPELRAEPRVPAERAPLEPASGWPLPILPRVFADPPPPRWLPVSGDALAFVAPSPTESARVIIYLHGMCGDARRITEWAPSAQTHGTLIALRAETACQSGDGHYWTSDPVYLDYRIKKAIHSVAAELGRPLDDSDVTLLGYSQGAQRAEELAHTRPNRYRRVALMSGPSAPSYARVAATERLVVTRGEREQQRSFRLAVDSMRRNGKRAAFVELPGAAHGEFGPAAGVTVSRVLAHLLD